MGGSDQWGNIVNGIELARRIDGTQLFGLTTPLITTAAGGKMGKTAQGAVWLNADQLSPYDYWQFWRNTEDADVGRFLRLFTDLPLDEIARLEALEGAEINDAKKVAGRRGDGDAARRRGGGRRRAETARKTFEEGGAGEALPTLKVAGEIALVDALVGLGLVASKNEARRLIAQGGARIDGAARGRGRPDRGHQRRPHLGRPRRNTGCSRPERIGQTIAPDHAPSLYGSTQHLLPADPARAPASHPRLLASEHGNRPATGTRSALSIDLVDRGDHAADLSRRRRPHRRRTPATRCGSARSSICLAATIR